MSSQPSPAPHDAHGATERARPRYRWLWPLTAVNGVGLVLATIGATTRTGVLPFLFPQIWGFSTGFGIALGVITVFVIVFTAWVRSFDGIDRKDRLYRFFAGVTIASTIMFLIYIVGATAILLLLGSAFA